MRVYLIIEKLFDLDDIRKKHKFVQYFKIKENIINTMC